MAPAWWETFFDETYLYLWSQVIPPEKTESEATGLWNLLALRAGSRVLDAPCGYGRLSLPLARRGASVVGVDQSATNIEHAERTRADMPAERLRYVRHDLRRPLADGGFDAAINVFTSLGYGTEQDDRAVLNTLAGALRPGGLLFVETAHRDQVVVRLAKAGPWGSRFADGTLMVEEPKFDAVAGRLDSTWHWSGPRGAGQKTASLRVYTATELVRLVEGAGLVYRSTHRGCSSEPFAPFDARLGILASRPA